MNDTITIDLCKNGIQHYNEALAAIPGITEEEAKAAAKVFTKELLKDQRAARKLLQQIHEAPGPRHLFQREIEGLSTILRSGNAMGKTFPGKHPRVIEGERRARRAKARVVRLAALAPR